jgi:hypothetical protein
LGRLCLADLGPIGAWSFYNLLVSYY